MSEIKSKKNRSGVHIVLGLFVLGCLVALLLNHYWKNIQDKLNLFEAGAMEITIDEPSISDITRIITPYQSIETKDRYAKISSRELKSYYIVLAANQEKVKLLDYAIKGVNENPKLSYESTAMSLVYMNPFLSNVPTALKNKIYSQISKHPKFNSLVKLVSESEDILNERTFYLSTNILLDYLSNNPSYISGLTSKIFDDSKQKLPSFQYPKISPVSFSPISLSPKLIYSQISNSFELQNNEKLFYADEYHSDESVVRYAIFSNFNYDGELSPYLGDTYSRLKLGIYDGKVKIHGVPRIAERAVLLKGGLIATSIGNKECNKEPRKICDLSNIVSQPIILPEEVTDLNSTITGQNKVTDLASLEVLNSGLYTVLLSGVDPYIDENSLGASQYNISRYFGYLLKGILGDDLVDSSVIDEMYKAVLKISSNATTSCFYSFRTCLNFEEVAKIVIPLALKTVKDKVITIFTKQFLDYITDKILSGDFKEIHDKASSLVDLNSKLAKFTSVYGLSEYFASYVARGNNPYYARFGIQKFSALLAPIINEISSSSPANLPVLLPEKFPTFSGVQLYPKVFSTESSLGVSIYISPTNQGTATLIGSLYMEKTTLNQLNVPYARYLARSTENSIAPDVTAIHGDNCLVPKTVYVRPDLEGYYTINLCGGSISGIHRIEWLDKQVIYSISWRGFGNIAPYIDNQPFNKDTLDQQYSQEFISIASSMASNLPLEKK